MPTTRDVIVETMIEAGTRRVYGLPGLGVSWTLPAFHARQNEIDIVLTRNEHIASIMAQAAGLLTGRPGVMMAQGPFAGTLGGPGILESYMSGTPMVILTDTSDYDGFGQKGVYQGMTGEYGAGDVKSILSGMTKYCSLATEPQEAIYGLQLAYKHASLPRQGPAALIMKTSMIRQEMPAAPRARLHASEGHFAYTPARPDPAAVDRLAVLLRDAENPLFVAGNGIRLAGAGEALERLALRLGAAVATSYNAKGVVDETCAIGVGMLGNWGHRTANRAVAAADLVVMLGASMGPDYTKFEDPEMIRPGDQTLVQVDIDPRNAGWVYPVDLAITGDVGDVIEALAGAAVDDDRCRSRLAALARLKEETDYGVLPEFETASGTVHHVDIVRALQDFLGPDDLLTLDAGANRIWTTHGLRVAHRGQVLTPGGLGGMGWGAPAAVAAKIEMPEKRVTCLAGDGGFAMTMQAMMTAVQQNRQVVAMVSNNKGLGMVRDNLGDQNIGADFADVDFARIAEGMGCRGMRVDHRDGLLDALEEAHKDSVSVIIDVAVDPEASHEGAVDR